MRKHTRADGFAIALRDELNAIAPPRLRECWTCEAGLKGSRERADVLAKCWDASGGDEVQVLIEVELRRGNPVVNALKTWLWARTRKPGDPPVILMHALSAYYRNRRTWKKYMEFVRERIQEDSRAKLTYVIIPFKYRPKRSARGIGGAGKQRARHLARRIAKKLATIHPE